MAGSTEIGDKAVVPEHIMQFLSNELSTEWKAVGRYLGIREAKLENIQADNSLSEPEQVYLMFISWKQAKGREATYGVLFEVLTKVGQGVLIEYIKKFLGTGCLAALLEDRCVLSLEKDVAKIRHMKVRVST